MDAIGFTIDEKMNLYDLYVGDTLKNDAEELEKKVNNYFNEVEATLNSLELEGNGLSPADFLIGGNYIIAEPLNELSKIINEIKEDTKNLSSELKTEIIEERKRQVNELKAILILKISNLTEYINSMITDKTYYESNNDTGVYYSNISHLSSQISIEENNLSKYEARLRTLDKFEY